MACHVHADICEVRPIISQNESHPFFRNDKLRRFCEGHNIHFSAYSPLGSQDSASTLNKAGLEARSPPSL